MNVGFHLRKISYVPSIFFISSLDSVEKLIKTRNWSQGEGFMGKGASCTP